MAPLAIFFGLVLIALGAVGYLAPELLGEGPSGQPTALIPAAFGAGLVICGLVTLARPGARKHAMHFAALLGVLGLVGALMRPVMKLAKGEAIDYGSAAFRSQAAMAALCLLFVILCVRSFINARRARSAT
jgi:hypothetical protein